jgi:hypothetical protein
MDYILSQSELLLIIKKPRIKKSVVFFLDIIDLNPSNISVNFLKKGVDFLNNSCIILLLFKAIKCLQFNNAM